GRNEGRKEQHKDAHQFHELSFLAVFVGWAERAPCAAWSTSPTTAYVLSHATVSGFPRKLASAARRRWNPFRHRCARKLGVYSLQRRNRRAGETCIRSADFL